MEWEGEPGKLPLHGRFGETCSAFVYHVPAATMKGVRAPEHHHYNEQIRIVLRGDAADPRWAFDLEAR